MARPRTPTSVKRLKGTLRKHRENPAEPNVELAIPEAPSHLSHSALKLWNKLGPILYDLGIITKADAIAFEALCECYAEVITARRTLAERGALSYEATRRGAKIYKPYPELARISDADRRLQSWLTKFGLSPADRSRVSAAAQAEAEDDPWTRL